MINEFLRTNLIIFMGIPGLLYFLMGFIVLVQSRNFNKLSLARNLPLLGAFGILQALAAWGVFFIPAQATYLSSSTIHLLRVVNLLLYVFSFGALGLFGSRFWMDLYDRHHWLSRLPLLLGLIWLVGFLLYPIVYPMAEYQAWIKIAYAGARYLVGLPSIVLTGMGLYAQHVELQLPRAKRLAHHPAWMIASLMLVGLSMLWSEPDLGILTAMWGKTYDALELVYLLPTLLLRSLSGLLLLLFSVQLLDVFAFDNQRCMDEVRQMQAVLDERDRIARELHDGTLQSLYAVGLRLESDVCMAGHIPDDVRHNTREILSTLRHVMTDMRGYVMNLKGATAHQPLHQRLELLVSDVSRTARVPIEYKAVEVPMGDYDETEVNHICQIVHEALSNALQHGQAKHIAVSLAKSKQGVQVTVRDDGKGFTPASHINPGHHGLRHMHQRARILGGRLTVQSTPGAGTVITLQVPLKGGAM